MRKINIFAALVVAMSAFSCVEEPTGPSGVAGAAVFEASFGAVGKAVLEPGKDESKVAWEAGDQVSVLAGNQNYLYLAASAGYSTILETEASDVPSEGTYYAVYPYDEDAAIIEEKLSTTLPEVQTAVLGSFSTHLAVARTTGTKLAFKNVCGLVKITVDAENVTKVVFEGNNGEVVAGGIDVTVSDAPTWNQASDKGATSVTLLPAQGQTTLAKGSYYFAALPQTFERGFKVTAYKGDEASVIRNVFDRFTLERADIVGGRAFGIDGSGTEADPYILKTPQDMVDMRSLTVPGGEVWFRMACDIDMKNIDNWVPLNYAEPFTRIIHFDGNNKTISNFKPSTWVDGEGEATGYPTGYPSFFGVLVGSCKDLTIADAAIEEAFTTTGILASYVGTNHNSLTARTTTNVTNVRVSGEISTTVNKAGGMAGACYNANFENCQAEVSIRTASTDAGGFVGQLEPKGKNTFKNCTAKTTLTSFAGDKCRCGGFIGWNRSLNTTIDNCRVLNGSTITDESERTTKQMPMFGGFIAFADNVYPDENNPDITPSVLTVKNSSADIIVDAGPMSRVNSLFIAQTGYQSTITLENCTAKGKVTSGDNYAGGLLGYKNSAAVGTVTITGCTCEGEVSAGYGAGGIVGGVEGGTVIISDSKVIGTITCAKTRAGGLIGLAGNNSTTEITDSYFEGTITGQGYLGGAVGGIADRSVKSTIARTYAKGSITGTGNYIGGLVGAAQSPVQSVSDCYSVASVASAAGTKQAGGLVGVATTPIKITNCFASGNVTVGTVAAGLVGRICAAESTVSKCIAWNSNVEAFASSLSGAIIASLEKSGTYSDCVRKSDMVVKVAGAAQTLTDQDNITTVSSTIAYNGKATNATTISAAAKSLGWNENIWDLSGDVPVLNDSYSGEDGTHTTIVYPVAGGAKTKTLLTDGFFTQLTVSEGITYYNAEEMYDAVSGAVQTVNVLEVDLNNPANKVRFYMTSRSTTSSVGKSTNSIACINAAYEQDAIYNRTDGVNHSEVTIRPTDTDESKARRFWKHEGAIVGDGARKIGMIYGAKGHSTATWDGISSGGFQAIEIYKKLQEPNVFASAPMLIDDYILVGTWFVPEPYRSDSSAQSSLNSEDYRRHQGTRHPRTAVALTADNDLLIITVDGRYPGRASGMSAMELTYFINTHFQPRWALNMDGGGSTTMYIKGSQAAGYGRANDLVNHPCQSGSTWTTTTERELNTFFLIQKN